MDTTVPRITFDANGVCNFCHFHDQLELEYPLGQGGTAQLEKFTIRSVKAPKTKNMTASSASAADGTAPTCFTI